METAKLALDAANGLLSGVKKTIVSTPIDADPRVAGPLGYEATATEALKVAQDALKTTQNGLGDMAKVASFIETSGIGAILDVRDASFTTSLNGVKDGEVTLSATLSFLRSPAKSYAFHFKFSDPADGARTLAKQLVPSL